MKKDNQSLSHTTWKCKYHIVFGPKYRRQIIYGKYNQSIDEILRELCERKGVEILEATMWIPWEEIRNIYENKFKMIK